MHFAVCNAVLLPLSNILSVALKCNVSFHFFLVLNTHCFCSSNSQCLLFVATVVSSLCVSEGMYNKPNG